MKDRSHCFKIVFNILLLHLKICWENTFDIYEAIWISKKFRDCTLLLNFDNCVMDEIGELQNQVLRMAA